MAVHFVTSCLTSSGRKGNWIHAFYTVTARSGRVRQLSVYQRTMDRSGRPMCLDNSGGGWSDVKNEALHAAGIIL